MRAMPFAEWVTLGYRLKPGGWNGPARAEVPADRRGPLGLVVPGPADGRFADWYVNLEEPGVRWDDGDVAGVDMVDQDLDVWVPPDRRWRWKDEEEFAERLGFSEHYWVADEAAVRAEGERVIKLVEAAEFPFDGTWCDFAPDRRWTVPDALPRGWDRPAVR